MEWWVWILIILAILLLAALISGYFYNQKYAKIAAQMAEKRRLYGNAAQY